MPCYCSCFASLPLSSLLPLTVEAVITSTGPWSPLSSSSSLSLPPPHTLLQGGSRLLRQPSREIACYRGSIFHALVNCFVLTLCQRGCHAGPGHLQKPCGRAHDLRVLPAGLRGSAGVSPCVCMISPFSFFLSDTYHSWNRVRPRKAFISVENTSNGRWHQWMLLYILTADYCISIKGLFGQSSCKKFKRWIESPTDRISFMLVLHFPVSQHIFFSSWFWLHDELCRNWVLASLKSFKSFFTANRVHQRYLQL